MISFLCFSSYSMQLLLKNIPLFFILTVCNRSFDTVLLNHHIYCGLLLKNTFTGFSFIQKMVTDGSIPSVESEPMDRWASVFKLAGRRENIKLYSGTSLPFGIAFMYS